MRPPAHRGGAYAPAGIGPATSPSASLGLEHKILIESLIPPRLNLQAMRVVHERPDTSVPILPKKLKTLF